MSSNSTGQFHPDGAGVQTDPGGASVFGSTLFYVGNGQSGSTIHVKICNLAAEDVTASSAWAKYDLPGDQIAFYNNDAPQTDRGMSAVTLTHPTQSAATPSTTRLYCFWSDSNSTHDNHCYASFTEDSSFNTSAMWHEHIQLYDSTSGSNQLTIEHGEVVAYAYTDKVVLAGFSDDKKSVRFFLFDPQDIHQDGNDFKWLPAHTTSITATQLDTTFSTFRKDSGATVGKGVSADWFTDGLDNYMMLGLFDDSDNVVNLVALTLDTHGLPTLNGVNTCINDAHQGVCVRRDPAGRIRVYWADDDHDLQVSTVATDDISTLRVSSGNLNGETHDIQEAASVAFAMGSITEDSTGLISQCDCREIVLYADHNSEDYGDIECQIANYGTVVTHRQFETVDYSAAQTQIPFVLNAMMDPFPIAAVDTSAITANSEMIDLTYGTSQSQSQSHRAEESTAYGVSASASVTVLNVTAKVETSLSAGPTSAAGGTEREIYSEEKTGMTFGGAGAVDPNGALFYAEASICRDAYYMLDPSGDNATGGPDMTSIYPLPGTRRTDAFPVYTSVPGDLSSYQRSAINDRMDTLFPPDSPYRSQFGDWSDYVGEVIEANAIALGANGEPYLEFAVGPTGLSSASYHQVQSSFVESGWTITAAAAAGISAEISSKEIFFGIEFAAAVEAMVNITYESKNTTTTESEQSWGIQVDFKPPTSTLVINTPYTARMYLLPANARWTAELQAAMAATGASVTDLAKIDPASAPWRIVFVLV